MLDLYLSPGYGAGKTIALLLCLQPINFQRGAKSNQMNRMHLYCQIAWPPAHSLVLNAYVSYIFVPYYILVGVVIKKMEETPECSVHFRVHSSVADWMRVPQV